MEYIVKFNGDSMSWNYPTEMLNDHYAIVDLEPELMESFLRSPEIEYAEPAILVFLSSLYNVGTQAYSPANSRGSGTVSQGAGVIVGIIDSGIDVTHPAFRTPDNRSRILSLWDMGADCPDGSRKGRVFQAEELDSLAEQSRDVIGHGTAVAGVAAGVDGVAPGASLIVVKLGERGSRTTDIMRGIKYIIDEARRLNMPCVINLSYGTNNGSHQGQSLFESYLNEMAHQWKNIIVCASGNEGDGGHHFRSRCRSGTPSRVDFAVASSTVSIYMVMWNDFADVISYELILPNGNSTGKFGLTSSNSLHIVDNVAVHVYNREPTPHTLQQEVVIKLHCASRLPMGTWTLVCYGDDIISGGFDIWLPTLEEVGEGTAFLQPNAEMTATLPSTAERVISVGGYRLDTDTLSIFSGQGEVRPGGNTLPDLVAPAEDIRTARAGGGYTVFSGTSMAAPFVAGAAALMMEWGIIQGNDPCLYAQRLRAFLHRCAARSSYISYPNPLWGYGKLDIPNTLHILTLDARNRRTLHEDD